MKLKIYVDEAGRGPLAGPVVVGMIIPLEEFDSSIFFDSKKIKEKNRIKIFNEIKKLEKDGKLLYSFGYSNNFEIDKFGIIKSLNIAFKRALLIILLKKTLITEISNNGEIFLQKEKIKKRLNNILRNIEEIPKIDFKKIINDFQKLEKIYGILLDGNSDFGLSKDLGYKIITIIKGDDRNKFIGGASIIAKCIRDAYMYEISEKVPKYNFAQHKGYGTVKHRQAIKDFGICDLHRKSFCRNCLN